MRNKKFRDLSNNRIVEVTDQFEDIIILDNKNKIKMNQLLNKGMFEEVVDPSAFLNNQSLINSFAEQIKKIPLDDWERRALAEDMGYDRNDDIQPMNESVILPYDPEVEKQELLRKAQTMYGTNNTSNLVQKQMESLKGILDEDVEIEQMNKMREIQRSIPLENSQQVTQTIIQEQIKEKTKMDPILEMFKNVKRNTNFRIEFAVENKIPRVDFIEMMEDSYNTSIIDFLAQEFTDEILRDPSKIKDKIKGKLMDLVYPPEDIEKRLKQND